MTRETIPARRLGAILAALAAATAGYALAGARVGDALSTFSLTRLAGCGIALAVLAGLALAVELGGPPAAARAGRTTRLVRAALRRRFRHGRTRAEIARVEAGLTLSVCLILTATAFILASAKSILVILTAGGLLAAVQAARALSRLVSFDPVWSGLAGFLSGLATGYLLA
ncbi:hypothetical protein [Enterovirga sp.]|uniref:hypothetical protein n=1 Tax=Enterovirga sp. TaxID=2026350 RepID=UPI002B5E3497|nr:hypothetical protein [Enterovirga sp.]HMO30479.1 hypothetical protein [Enterovirga sp.]